MAKNWGRGRVAVIALRSILRAEIEAGHPLTEIFEKHQAKLGGISYPTLTRLVRRYVTQHTPAQPKGKPNERIHDGGGDGDGPRFRHKSDPKAPALWTRAEPVKPR